MKEVTYEEYCKLSYEERKNFTGIIKFDFGLQHYQQNGQLHKTDGPAIIRPDGSVMQYFIYGTQTTKKGQELYHSLMKLKGLL